MGARAPQAIYSLWDAVKAAIPAAQLGGIVGDAAHSFGYHLARQQLGSGDYSVQLSADRLGASDCASALDVSLPADLMKVCTGRLLDAAKASDPRLHPLREFCGTLNGYQTYPWDLSSNSSEGVDSWDNSHLWHIHLSFYREYADNAAALLPIAGVLAGHPLEDDLTPEQSNQLSAIYEMLCNGASSLNRYLHQIDADVYADRKVDGADLAVDEKAAVPPVAK